MLPQQGRRFMWVRLHADGNVRRLVTLVSAVGAALSGRPGYLFDT